MFGLPYEIVLTTHVSAFIFNVTLVVIADIHGLLWISGRCKNLPERRMMWLHRLLNVGLILAISSGVWLFLETADYLLTVPAFYSKMFFIFALVVNSFVIGAHIKIASTQSYGEISASDKRKLILSGAVSTISWVGAFVSALFLGL